LKVVEYVTPLGRDGRRRTRHVRVKNNIIEFIVQYELKIKDEWYPVVRFDTVHGFAHKDIVPYKGEVQKETLLFNDYNLALTFAEKDLRDNWQKYRDQYLKETGKND